MTPSPHLVKNERKLTLRKNQGPMETTQGFQVKPRSYHPWLIGRTRHNTRNDSNSTSAMHLGAFLLSDWYYLKFRLYWASSTRALQKVLEAAGIWFSSWDTAWDKLILYWSACVSVLLLLPVPAPCACTPEEAATDGPRVGIPATFLPDPHWVSHSRPQPSPAPGVASILGS